MLGFTRRISYFAGPGKIDIEAVLFVPGKMDIGAVLPGPGKVDTKVILLLNINRVLEVRIYYI